MQIPQADLTGLMDTLKQIRLEHEAEEAKLNESTSKKKKDRKWPKCSEWVIKSVYVCYTSF